MWTTENRPKYDRSGLRYPSDLTDAEWLLIGPLIPGAKRGGNKRTVDERAIVNGVMYILSTGCQWAALPTDLPPRSTVNDYFRRWDDDGTLARIHHALYVQCREQAGREASPTAAIIDRWGVAARHRHLEGYQSGRLPWHRNGCRCTGGGPTWRTTLAWTFPFGTRASALLMRSESSSARPALRPIRQP
jgi:transposase